jgi:hypothetical protein
VNVDGYRAHFFDLYSGDTTGIALRDGSGRMIEVASGGPFFELIGPCLPDGCDYLGPLFVSTPPHIRVAGGSWESIGKIVLGVEGKGTGKWRTYLEPERSRPEQSLPTSLTERRAGWYFARFYDLQDDLIDSLVFRFAAGLQEIKINETTPFPPEKGYEHTTVEFYHDVGWRVRSAESRGRVKIEPDSGRTILRIPPTAMCDYSEWFVGPTEGPEVKVAVLVERVWWVIGNERREPAQWQDKCLSLTREALIATSEDAIWFRLPKRRWTEHVFVGFSSGTRRRYEVRTTERIVAIPLRDFCDSKELGDRSKNQFLRAWLIVGGRHHEADIARIPADSSERDFDIRCVPAARVARVLTELRHLTSGPLRLLLKEVRREYRRPRGPSANRNDEFVKRGLCMIAVFLQLAEAHKLPIPKLARRWKATAQLASRGLPESMRDVWNRYAKLEGRRSGPASTFAKDEGV